MTRQNMRRSNMSSASAATAGAGFCCAASCRYTGILMMGTMLLVPVFSFISVGLSLLWVAVLVCLLITAAVIDYHIVPKARAPRS